MGYGDCKEMILESFNLYSKTTLVIDALDESDTAIHNLVETLVDLMDQSTRPVKIFISSRPDRAFMDVFESRSVIEINSENQASDIEKYLNKHIYYHPWFEEREEMAKSLIKETFAFKSSGMFRWVYLQTQALKALTTQAAIENWAKNVPKDLQWAYDQLWDRIEQGDPNDFALAERVIKWVMCSADTDIYIILEASRYLSEGATVVRTERHTKNQLLNLCQDLLTVNNANCLVFPHASVAEYFETSHWNLADCDLLASTVSLSHLMTPMLGTDEGPGSQGIDEVGYNSDDEHAKETAGNFYRKFHQYVVRNWHLHVNRYDEWLETHESLANTETLSELLKSFLGLPDNGSPQYRDLVAICHPSLLKADLSPSDISLLGIFHLGFYHTLREWWEGGHICKEMTLRIDSEILVSCTRTIIGQDHVKMCEHLIKLVDDKDSLTKLLGTLYDLIRVKRADMAKVFISNAKWDLIPDEWPHIVYFAAWGSCELLEWLLNEKLAAPNLIIRDNDNEYGSLLIAAMDSKEFAMTADVFIKAGENVNAVVESDDYATALLATAATPPWKSDLLQRVAFLTNRSADVNFVAERGWYGSPLEAAICNQGVESRQTSSFLLDKVSDDHLTTISKAGEHGSLLAAAAYYGKINLLEAMISRVGQDRALELLRQSRHDDDSWADPKETGGLRQVAISLLRKEVPGVYDELLQQTGFLPEEMEDDFVWGEDLRDIETWGEDEANTGLDGTVLTP